MHEFDAGKRTVFMHGIYHSSQIGQVAIIPHTGFGKRLHVACWVEVTLFGGDDSPAAFGLHTAHFYHAVREHAPHAVTVGDLIKPVWRSNRTNFHGFEQDIESGVALVAHGNIASGMRVAERYLNIGDFCGDVFIWWFGLKTVKNLPKALVNTFDRTNSQLFPLSYGRCRT